MRDQFLRVLMLGACVIIVSCSDDSDSSSGSAPDSSAATSAQQDVQAGDNGASEDRESTVQANGQEASPPPHSSDNTNPGQADHSDSADRSTGGQALAAAPCDEALEQEMALVDETADSFPTEQINSNGGAVLSRLAAAIEKHDPPSSIAASISDGFSCGDLRPSALEGRFDDGTIHVVRGQPGDGEHTGIAGIDTAFEQLLAPYRDGHVHLKFKIDRVDILSDSEATTRVIYLAMGNGIQGVIQQNAHWTVHWDISRGLDSPRIAGIEPHDFEEVSAPHVLFSDCTETALANGSLIDEMRRSTDYWWGRLDTAVGFSLYGDYGLSVGDFNDDGLDDLYICQPGTRPNRLLRHNGDGTVTDVSAGSGVDFLNDTINALFVDVDNDGHQDLVVGMGSHISVMRGDGTGQFTPAALIAVPNTTALSAADYDGDGLLDLYVCRYGERQIEGEDSLFDSRYGMPNVLLKNQGELQFVETTTEAGLDENNTRYSFAALWEDYDNDGDLDVYVANDFGRNNLYRNDGGLFKDVAGPAGVEDQAAGMGATWADFDHDGLMDLYVSNMFSSAGGRIAYQRNFAPGGVEEAAAEAQYFARGNSLFRNLGDGTFEDVSETAGVSMGRWSWGSEFADLNGDGFADIVVPNGFVTNHLTKDL